MSGSWTSSRTTEGRTRPASEMAEPPSATSPTTSKPLAARRVRTVARKPAWSSTMSTDCRVMTGSSHALATPRTVLALGFMASAASVGTADQRCDRIDDGSKEPGRSGPARRNHPMRRLFSAGTLCVALLAAVAGPVFAGEPVHTSFVESWTVDHACGIVEETTLSGRGQAYFDADGNWIREV